MYVELPYGRGTCRRFIVLWELFLSISSSPLVKCLIERSPALAALLYSSGCVCEQESVFNYLTLNFRRRIGRCSRKVCQIGDAFDVVNSKTDTTWVGVYRVKLLLSLSLFPSLNRKTRMKESKYCDIKIIPAHFQACGVVVRRMPLVVEWLEHYLSRRMSGVRIRLEASQSVVEMGTRLILELEKDKCQGEMLTKSLPRVTQKSRKTTLSSCVSMT